MIMVRRSKCEIGLLTSQMPQHAVEFVAIRITATGPIARIAINGDASQGRMGHVRVVHARDWITKSTPGLIEPLTAGWLLWSLLAWNGHG
jgi:hypothetical protein